MLYNNPEHISEFHDRKIYSMVHEEIMGAKSNCSLFELGHG